jgi:hypothetical protein
MTLRLRGRLGYSFPNPAVYVRAFLDDPEGAQSGVLHYTMTSRTPKDELLPEDNAESIAYRDADR